MSLGKVLIRTLTASSLALTAAVPAIAQVSVGVGVGGPGYHGRWCYNHPGACRAGSRAYVGGPAVAVGVPAIGVYVAGRGYWGGHGWYAHRYWDHGGWRYR
jgi:hypothetical protein